MMHFRLKAESAIYCLLFSATFLCSVACHEKRIDLAENDAKEIESRNGTLARSDSNQTISGAVATGSEPRATTATMQLEILVQTVVFRDSEDDEINIPIPERRIVYALKNGFEIYSENRELGSFYGGEPLIGQTVSKSRLERETEWIRTQWKELIRLGKEGVSWPDGVPYTEIAIHLDGEQVAVYSAHHLAKYFGPAFDLNLGSNENEMHLLRFWPEFFSKGLEYPRDAPSK